MSSSGVFKQEPRSESLENPETIQFRTKQGVKRREMRRGLENNPVETDFSSTSSGSSGIVHVKMRLEKWKQQEERGGTGLNKMDLEENSPREQRSRVEFVVIILLKQINTGFSPEIFDCFHSMFFSSVLELSVSGF